MSSEKAGIAELEAQRSELDHIAKMLVRRDFALMEIKEKREAEMVELKKTKKELEEAKSVLEIKVKERTGQLEELAKSLEAKVKERTRELQEKMTELERFNRLAVGREIKMVELKKELEEYRQNLLKKEFSSLGKRIDS